MGLDIAHLISSISKLVVRTSRQIKKNKINSQIRLLKVNDQIINNAKKQLDKWLAHPNELGFSPEKIEYTNSFVDKDNIKCLIFKYQETAKSKCLLGIVSDSGTFSEMKEYNKNTELEDAIKILEMLKNYWKKKAEEMQTYSVNVFVGKDKIIRFVPGVRNRYGIYVPIAEGLEVPLNSTPKEIGEVYLKTANNALKHLGEDLDIKAAKPKYISFKGFRSQKEFDLKHFCFSSFLLDGKIKFTFLHWHKNEFCLLKSDVECVVEISKTDDPSIIGNAIIEIINKANESYPELNILSNT